MNLKDKDFIDDKYVFEKNGFSGVIDNQGDIKALEGGTIAIIAPQVENKGEIETKFALDKFFIVSFEENLFIRKP